MKKFLSFIALAGLLVACQPEEIMTAFKVGSAVLEINVSATDLLSGDVTIDGSTYSLNAVVPSGYPAAVAAADKLTFTSKEGKALPEAILTIQIMKAGSVLGETAVNIPRVLAGEKFNTSAKIIYGQPATKYEFSFTTDFLGIDPVLLSETPEYLTTTGAYTHDGNSNWDNNATSEYIEFTAQYQAIAGVILFDNTVNVIDPDFEDVVNLYAAAYNEPYDIYTDSYTYPIPPYSYFQIISNMKADVYVCKIFANKDGEAPVQIGELNYGICFNDFKHNIINYNPAIDHGDGHGHGGGNAGGGIGE